MKIVDARQVLKMDYRDGFSVEILTDQNGDQEQIKEIWLCNETSGIKMITDLVARIESGESDFDPTVPLEELPDALIQALDEEDYIEEYRKLFGAIFE